MCWTSCGMLAKPLQWTTCSRKIRYKIAWKRVFRSPSSVTNCYKGMISSVCTNNMVVSYRWAVLISGATSRRVQSSFAETWVKRPTPSPLPFWPKPMGPNLANLPRVTFGLTPKWLRLIHFINSGSTRMMPIFPSLRVISPCIPKKKSSLVSVNSQLTRVNSNACWPKSWPSASTVKRRIRVYWRFLSCCSAAMRIGTCCCP